MTRLQNNVKLPLCVDPSARARLKHFPDGLSSAELARHSQAVAAQQEVLDKEAKAQTAQQRGEWQKRKAREETRASQARTSPCLSGMDPDCEAPPPDKRDWCPYCVHLRVLRANDLENVERLQKIDETATDPAQRLYNRPVPSQELPPFRGTEHLYDHRHAYQQEFADAGVDTFSMDAYKSLHWDLFTHAGFHTWPHHDASGMATWVYIRHGCKIWCPLVPRLARDRTLNIEDLFNCMHHILRPPPHLEYQEHADAFYMFLLPHDVL